MQILNKPRCRNFERCGNLAITVLDGHWLCGDCLIKIQEKIKKLREKIIFEE